MIKVNIQIDYNKWNKKIKNPKKYFFEKLKKISKIEPFIKKKKIVFTILLTNSTKMKKLNYKFRNINKTTDVLSFPFFSPNNIKISKKNSYIGDIAVGYEIVNRYSKKNNFILEFEKTWIHGLLHLIGYDHIKNRDYLKMNKTEKKILNLIS